jgi:transposase
MSHRCRILNAINLYIALGCAELGIFEKGKDASACNGLTPIQYSSGGKTKLSSIGKYVKNSVLCSQLITGTMSAVSHAKKQEGIAKSSPYSWSKKFNNSNAKPMTKNSYTAEQRFSILLETTTFSATQLS